MTDDAHVKLQFDKAISLRDDGRYHEAADAMSRLLDSDLSRRQRAAVTGFLAGLLLYDLDQPVRAEPLCRASVSLSPRSELASLGLFHALWALRRPLDAFIEMRRFVQLVGSEEYKRLATEIADSTKDPDRCGQAIRAFIAGETDSTWPREVASIVNGADFEKDLLEALE